MTDTRGKVQRAASEEEQRITAIVDRRVRETFKNGLPAGTYASYLWDGMKIVGAGGGSAAVGARVRRAAAFALSNNTITDLDFDTEDDDDANYWDETSSPLADIVVPSDGYYLFECTTHFAANATGIRESFLQSSALDGNQIGGHQRLSAASAGETVISGCHVYRLAASGIVRLRALQTSGGSLNVTAASCNVIRLGSVP